MKALLFRHEVLGGAAVVAAATGAAVTVEDVAAKGTEGAILALALFTALKLLEKLWDFTAKKMTGDKREGVLERLTRLLEAVERKIGNQDQVIGEIHRSLDVDRSYSFAAETRESIQRMADEHRKLHSELRAVRGAVDQGFRDVALDMDKMAQASCPIKADERLAGLLRGSIGDDK